MGTADATLPQPGFLATAHHLEGVLAETREQLDQMVAVIRRMTLTPLSSKDRTLVADALDSLDANFSGVGFDMTLRLLRQLESEVTHG